MIQHPDINIPPCTRCGGRQDPHPWRMGYYVCPWCTARRDDATICPHCRTPLEDSAMAKKKTTPDDAPVPGSPDRRSAKRRAPGGVDRFMTAFRLRTDLKAWLEARAEKNGRTMSAEIEAILLAEQGRG